MKTTEVRSNISLRMRNDIKNYAKTAAKLAHRSFSNYIEYLIIQDKNRHNYPEKEVKFNNTTMKSIENSQNDIGVSDVDLSSFESFIKSMD